MRGVPRTKGGRRQGTPLANGRRRLGRGLIDSFGGTKLGVWTIKHVLSPSQRFSYRLTRGRVSLTGSKPTLLLTTIGRRSGQERTVPVFYVRDGERFVVCNANPGFERPNPWTLNLRATPMARVEVGGETIQCRGHEADEAEVERYWPRFLRIWPAYQVFFERSGERSLFVLEPARE